ncbi:serine hydrolase [filamentous cyanobacterium LEGE 11480]|uniref:Serine hydrolase n=2 Tax=Romeriopsis TaxID=2992131 RepID=A0A928VH98_9CYAN|nr:serine hydrolase [Romeriopsis navalis LEGE 11480]
MGWRVCLCLSIAALANLFPGIVIAQEAAPPPQTVTPKITPAAVLTRFFQTDEVKADWFTPEFLAAVPLPQVQGIIQQIKQLGQFESVQAAADGFVLQLSQVTIPAKIALTADGKISGLLFSPPTQNLASLEAAIAQFKQLPGQVSVLVRAGKTPIAALNSTQRLGVGSAFKLAVLDVLQSQIAEQKLTWQTVVPLQSQFKSLPSGKLQTWPDGALLTVQTLAALMISESDNTATDHLIQLVGRENLEAMAPPNRPFLMTREFFQLKSPSNQGLLNYYRQGNLEQQRSVLTALAKRPLPDVAEFTGDKPQALDVEWFFSATELCQLIDRVADLPLTRINPGVAAAQDWQQVAFKGGSEVGVLNFTTQVRSPDGRIYCMAATWNHNQAINQTRFASLYGGILNILQNQKK